MYSFTERVRYSETDETGHLSMTALLNYFQDCATFHSADVGLPAGVMQERGLMWVLSAWHIEAERMPEIYEYVKVRTIPYSFRSFLGRRNFILEDAQGKTLARADSLWTLVDTASGRPARIPEDFPEMYGVGQALEAPVLSRHIKCEGQLLESCPPIVVGRHLLDSNGHMNNGQYVRLARSLLPGGFKALSLRVEYKQPVYEGDELHASVFKDAQGYTVELSDAEGKAYAIVEFK